MNKKLQGSCWVVPVDRNISNEEIEKLLPIIKLSDKYVLNDITEKTSNRLNLSRDSKMEWYEANIDVNGLPVNIKINKDKIDNSHLNVNVPMECCGASPLLKFCTPDHRECTEHDFIYNYKYQQWFNRKPYLIYTEFTNVYYNE